MVWHRQQRRIKSYKEGKEQEKVHQEKNTVYKEGQVISFLI